MNQITLDSALAAAPNTTCRKCGVRFDDINGQAICDVCMVERVNGAGELEDDEDDNLFTIPRRTTATTARITCRVCNRYAVVSVLATGLLCDSCRSDLVATARHIAEVKLLAETRYSDAVSRLDADVAHADVVTQERYGRVLGAFAQVVAGAMQRASYDRAYSVALHADDGLSALLRMRDAYLATSEETARVLGWAENAAEEVEAAR